MLIDKVSSRSQISSPKNSPKNPNKRKKQQTQISTHEMGLLRTGQSSLAYMELEVALRSTQPNPSCKGSSWSPAGTHGAEAQLGHVHPEIDAETARRDRFDNIIRLCGVHVTQATKITAVWASTPTSKLPALRTNSLPCLSAR